MNFQNNVPSRKFKQHQIFVDDVHLYDKQLENDFEISPFIEERV
jgi:hypothetical protein